MKHVDAFLVGWIWLQVVGGGCRGFFTWPARLAAEVLLLVKCGSRLLSSPSFCQSFFEVEVLLLGKWESILVSPSSGATWAGGWRRTQRQSRIPIGLFFYCSRMVFYCPRIVFNFPRMVFYCPRIVLPSLSLFSPGLPSTMLVAQWSQPWLPESSRIHNWETSRSDWAGQLQ